MIAKLQSLSRRHTSPVQQAKEGSPFLRGDPQYTVRMGTPGTPFYRENGDPGSPFSRDPQNFMTPALMIICSVALKCRKRKIFKPRPFQFKFAEFAPREDFLINIDEVCVFRSFRL